MPDEPQQPLTPGGTVRALIRQAKRLRQQTSQLEHLEAVDLDRVRSAYQQFHQRAVDRRLAEMPLSAVRDGAGGGLRLDPLEAAGYHSVRSLRQATAADLDRIPGIGAATAGKVLDAVRDLVRAVEDSTRVRIDLDRADVLGTGLLESIAHLEIVQRARSRAQGPDPEQWSQLITASAPMRGRVRMLFARRARRDQAAAAIRELQTLLGEATASRLGERLELAIAGARRRQPVGDAVWEDFERRSPEYYGVLDRAQDLGLGARGVASQGFLPSDLAQTVREQPLDTRFLTIPLRGYQSFGAKFMLVQRRVVLGDEMGLGKTVQALAVLAHLAVSGAGPVLVVCPASLLVNWAREIASRTLLSAQLVYGADRAQDLAAWLDAVKRPDVAEPWGDASSLSGVTSWPVAVTSYESLRSLSLPADVVLAALIVDEAHYVKNPEAHRSQAVAAWARQSDRVLFLTGTPMENRVQEFAQLVGHLQPGLAANLDRRQGAAGPDAFRRAVSNVYLRRNAEDVLTELPELVETEDWESFTVAEQTAYRDALRRSDFHSMRRVAWTADPEHSGKLQRLLELLDEAAANGLKVVVFSYYRDVIATVMDAVRARRPEVSLHGPLTGSTPAAHRQHLVDAFTIDTTGSTGSTDGGQPGAAVLVCQIQAGGVGLNLQAASVVVLCEPQIKPTTEDQAIARAHRMGQVRSVMVHRLLTPGSVDERMLEILGAKTRLFDEYARRSDLADSSPDALDPQEQGLARQVIQDERARLGDAAASEPGPT